MVTIIEDLFGGYRQSPYIFNNFGFKIEVADGNCFEGVKAKTEYVDFYQHGKYKGEYQHGDMP